MNSGLFFKGVYVAAASGRWRCCTGKRPENSSSHEAVEAVISFSPSGTAVERTTQTTAPGWENTWHLGDIHSANINSGCHSGTLNWAKRPSPTGVSSLPPLWALSVEFRCVFLPGEHEPSSLTPVSQGLSFSETP